MMREKLEEAWERAYPKDVCGWSPAPFSLRLHFTRLLDAEAWLDAAVLLVPEGYDW